MSLAVCPGSFDPITLGHLDVVRRARLLFDGVVLAVARNASKTAWFSAEQRVALAREALADTDVRVEAVDGLVAQYAREIGATAIVKGLRAGADFDGEQPMALMNRHLAGIETVFLVSDGGYAHIASSLVRDIARHDGDVADLVPPVVARALRDTAHQGGSR